MDRRPRLAPIRLFLQRHSKRPRRRLFRQAAFFGTLLTATTNWLFVSAGEIFQTQERAFVLRYPAIEWNPGRQRAGLLNPVLGIPSPVRASSFSVAQRPANSNDELIAKGRSLYSSLCVRCHGEDGSATDYPGVVPLPGINLRLPASEIPVLSAPFAGRSFEGVEAEALIAYLRTLRGEKGFSNPGLAFSPYLLERKAKDRRRFRIIDLRPRADYEAGHVPNAVSWPSSALSLADNGTTDVVQTRSELARLGVDTDCFAVIYDETGGLEATSLWWNFRRTGHLRAAILDGGWKAWKAAGFPVSTQAFQADPIEEPVLAANPIGPRKMQSSPTPLGFGQGEFPAGVQFDWGRTTGAEGLLSAQEVGRYLDTAGLRAPGAYLIKGTVKELSGLVYVLCLLGWEPLYDAEQRVLFLDESGQARPE